MAGTWIMGVVNALFAILAYFAVDAMGRKTLLTLGQFTMGICLAFAGISVFYEWYMVSFISINTFIAFYQLSQGPVGWVYISEVAVDAASGFAIFGLFLNMIIVIATFEYMINGWFQAFGSFLFYGVCTLFGFFIFCFFLKETRGLTDL